MMRGASGDECGKLLGQEYSRPAEAGVLKKPQEATLTLTFYHHNHVSTPPETFSSPCVTSTFFALTPTYFSIPTQYTNPASFTGSTYMPTKYFYMPYQYTC
jgi:hypothetical protein